MSLMPGPEDVIGACKGCGASVYREHINRGLAGRWAGNLFCPHCLTEKKGGTADLERLSKADEGDGGGPAANRSASYAGFAGMYDLDTYPYKRDLLPAGRGATRMRIFHCKLSDGPVYNLNQQINEWLDAHPDYEIKFANTTIGTWEGKHAEQHIIVTVYY